MAATPVPAPAAHTPTEHRHQNPKQSKQDKQHKTADIMDVNPTFTHETVQHFHTPLLIHGHTHRENIHRNADYTRIVLGDWRDNYASILEVNAEGYRFIAL